MAAAAMLQALQALLVLLCNSFTYASSDFSVLTPSTEHKPLAIASNYSLARRQTDSNSVPDYTCSADRPCQNKACCGKSNVCGFGPVYCGDGCQSHCDAKAECGQYAEDPGAQCPLKVCCSQFGFCGTTSDFCDNGCQSNCGQPSKPGSGGDARNKIIGYWESWRANNVICGAMPPESIPAEALDQLNLAFIYVDPGSFELMPMDGGTVSELYERVANLKIRNPHLQVWISIGGWSFNDPGPYQSVFGSIAGDTRLSARFAQNCVDFMNQYGFDGVDIDWEYPGADDRGGTLSDVTNYPRMLGILQQTFKSGGKRFGLSITVPTSYWYLRWFDLMAIERNIDYFNLMSYDLHGIWDRTDPIGPYVYAHTNLTEIDLALDLFWRNGVDSSDINLGLGFYGRTFKLKDPKCSQVGCEFSGPGGEGPCTATAGILSYREIQTLLSTNNLFDSAHYDKTAGVYYTTYGYGTGSSWVSFDDSVSFQAKVDLANARGLSGLFIWAVDQDDANLDALRAVSGRDIVVPPAGSGTFGGFEIDKCYITDCGQSCNDGDTLMTKLNQDASSKGCDGKDHNQRSFCCPPNDAPDPSTCYWTGGPVNCHGQCAAGEVSMVLDDWGDSSKRCTNGGKKVWCCPATNGEAAISKCSLVKGRKCPSDKPQELTYVYDFIYGLVDVDIDYQTFCCPAEPIFNKCDWYGDNYYCNDNECPLGQVELFRNNGWHEDSPKNQGPCNKGRQQAYCCDAPFTEASPFLPVPLENLFPGAGSFPSTYDPVFAESFDKNEDLQPEPSAGQDPNKDSFAWIIMVGAPDDVQSFEKRDGSHLELFDCPNPHETDFSIQKARAICLTDSQDNDCEDILQGGVEGTVVRLPEQCGPDTWVRAVSYEESTNRTLPHHLEKRAKPQHRIYDFHYDYEFSNLRRDGGEVYVRVDASTHPGYWDEVVSRPAGSPIKRDLSTWREIDQRSYAENNPDDWKKRFDNLLGTGNVGLKKQYEFSQCLFSASATCSKGSAFASAYVSGEFRTTMDFGISLIGALRNFGFSEAFAFFRQESFQAKVQASLEAEAKLEFDSGLHPVGSFNTFGSNYNIKGILTINPYFSAEARVQAEARLSAQATVELTLTHPRFQYYLPTDLGNLPTEPTGSFEVTSRTGPISSLGEISAGVGGDVIVSLLPTIGLDISLQFGGKQLVDTSVKLTAQADTDFAVDATVGSSCNGLQVDIKGQYQAKLIVENALPGWKSGTYQIERPTPKSIYSDCLPWELAKRGIGYNDSAMPLDGVHLLPRQTTGDDLPNLDRTGTCAFSAHGVYCADDNDDPTPNCNVQDLQDDEDIVVVKRGMPDFVEDVLLDKFFDERVNISNPNHYFHEARGLEKRAGAKTRTYCDKENLGQFSVADLEGVNYRSKGTTRYYAFPDSSDIKSDWPNSASFTYDDPNDCNNYDIARDVARNVADTSMYGSEHVLESQMFMNFMNHNARYFSNLKDLDEDDEDEANPHARYYPEPRAGYGDSELAWCEYISRWWTYDPGSGTPNVKIVAAYPRDKFAEDEMYLLHESMNSRIKQAWFTGNALSYDSSSKLDKWIREADWSSALKALKRHIVTWKYFLDPDVASTLASQAKRVADYLEDVETDYIPHTVRTALDSDFDQVFIEDYEYQGLADLWRDFVREQHVIVQSRVKTFLLKRAQEISDANSGQQNQVIVGYIETLINEINSLTAWNIPWRA